MVTVVALRADPKCVRRGGGSSPLLQALDVNVLKERGRENVQLWIDGGPREDLH